MYGTLEELRRVDFGPPLHCLALVCADSDSESDSESLLGGGEPIVGLHPIEEDYLQHFSLANNKDKITFLPDPELEPESEAEAAGEQSSDKKST